MAPLHRRDPVLHLVVLPAPPREAATQTEADDGAAKSIIVFIASGFFLALAFISYVVVSASDCFTYNFTRPIWNGIKAWLYFCNLIVLTLAAIGIGLAFDLTHLILHVRLPDSSERQVRIHTEACWTIGAKKRAMDDLESKILEWQNRSTTPPALVQTGAADGSRVTAG